MLTNTHNKHKQLSELLISLKNDFNLTPCIGVEIEFYLIGSDSKQSNIIHKISDEIGYNIFDEKGNNQYEIDLNPSTNIIDYINNINNIRNKLKSLGQHHNVVVNFASKPFINDYGNSMHVHLNFLEDQRNSDEKQRINIYASILCHYVQDTLDAFLPLQEDYARLDEKYMAPTHISYGGNNRTVLIRIPDAEPLRIEHRLASSAADPYKVFYAILLSIYKGLSNPDAIHPMEKIYGNAYDLQYGLKRILR